MDLTGMITNDKLTEAGFSPPFNRHFTYRCFPAPLYGNWRIDFRSKEKYPNTIPNDCWYIYLCTGENDFTLRYVETMEQVFNFYKGICDKDLL
jgi:hypothetical protein